MAIYLSVDRRSFDGAMQVSINKRDKSGWGHGFRIAGPKYDGSGTTLLETKIDTDTAKEITRYLEQA